MDHQQLEEIVTNLPDSSRAGNPGYEMLVITLEPIHHPEAMVRRKPNEFVKPGNRVLKDLNLVAKIPRPETVKAVYRLGLWAVAADGEVNTR